MKPPTIFVRCSSFVVHLPSMLRILFLGDVIGEPGRRAVTDSVPRLKEKHAIDFVIVNGENSAAGRGITPRITIDLLRAGVAVITTGDHVWDQRDIVPFISTEPRLLRPLNYPPDTPGAGSIVLETAKGKVAVINVQGRTFMQPPLENPFLAIDAEVTRLRQETAVIFVDAHAETTSEKIALGRFLDGRVSAVVGTHTHTQTADEQIFPGGTAFLCDAGMCGPVESCLGREIEPIIQKFLTGRPIMYPVARGPVKLHGALIDIDETTGGALKIERFAELYEPVVAAPAVAMASGN
jgi:2',3'-cyclic-nucleotide 2'-phosphodiesterase